jgi:hypothetical protein
MMALPPWSPKSAEPVKAAMMAGFFCTDCDVRDDDAYPLWADFLDREGFELISTNVGQA